MLLRCVEVLDGPGGRDKSSSISSSSGIASRRSGLSSSPSSDEDPGLSWFVLCVVLKKELPDAFEDVGASGYTHSRLPFLHLSQIG